jgi:hypothetical protein
VPRVCKVCDHPRIMQINAWIVQGVSSGEIERRVGGLSRSSIRRHRQAGMHLAHPAERLAAERDQGTYRLANHRVRTKLRREFAPPEPPPAAPPPPAKPEPVNPPNKTFTWDEVLELKRRRNEWRRNQAWGRKQGRRQPSDPPSYSL